MIYVQTSCIHGVGVFTDAPISAGSVIETVRVIMMVGNDLADYAYGFDGGYFIGFGFACLYNHSRRNNASHLIDGSVLQIVALRDIQKNEEITIRYSKKYWQARGIKPK